MLTFSELLAIITIWALTAIGLFFFLRALWRRKK
jgi:energy-converting hydrogenase Eha subunit E